MKAEWMSDARKIPGEVMNFIRRIAVRAIEEKHYSPKLVSDLLGIDRTSIYDWLRHYRHQGEEALDTGKAPGGDWVITSDIDQWLKETISSCKFSCDQNRRAGRLNEYHLTGSMGWMKSTP